MKPVERFGAVVLAGVDWMGGMTSMFVRMIKVGVRAPIGLDDIAHQLLHLGVRSLPISTFLSVFIGMILAQQFGVTLMDFGAIMKLGDASSLALVKELVPTLLALTVGAKMAAGMTAELG